MKRIFFLIGIIYIVSCFKAFAQSLPVGTPVLDDYYRREQLLGKVDSNLSFTLRPLSRKSLGVGDVFDPDSSLRISRGKGGTQTFFANGHGVFQVLPLTWQQQFNSDHPYGWNDGAMIPAKGYQTMVSSGFYFKIGPLSIQLRPEYVYATNPSFQGFETASRSTSETAAYYYYYLNLIDAPERFGNSAYSKWFWGQSNIKLTFGAIEAGVSNENLWWGPGIQNALVLSNNAPGFKHITLNTSRPINTYIGQFEAQIIAGRLEESGFLPLVTAAQSTDSAYYIPKNNDWRYYTGFNINYHPKWIPGLTIGLTRTFNAYGKDVKSFKGYIPFFIPYSKVSTSGMDAGIGDPFARDQLTSMYARWLFTKAQAELYFEYGLNDNSYNLADFAGSPQHSRAYIVGIRKLLPIAGNNNQHILIGTEITQLSQSIDRLIRDAGGWYVHTEVKQGQTNFGQILGAGTGSGGNLQSIELSWVSGLKKIGLQFDRYEHSVDFSDANFTDINNSSRKWVDFAFSMHGECNYKNFLFNVKLQGIKSLNYEWILKDYTPGQYYIPHNTVYNLHGELGITYRF